MAQSHLGFIYHDGRGVPPNYAAAVKWFRKAADQGDDLAQSPLGALYSLGQGVPQDVILAHMWFNLSAAKGNPAAVKSRDLLAT
jgi:TPR repeat protein